MAGKLTTALEGASRPTLDVQLRRYNRSYRRRLRKFAHTSEKSKDLLYTFPAAAFTIAGRHGNPLNRIDAVRLVEDGASLRQVGQALGFPNWMRRLPPEAFVDAIGKVPEGAEFARRVPNLIPKNPEQTKPWLQWVLRANALCNEDFALWIASQKFEWHSDDDASAIVPLAAYAWYTHTDGLRARGFIETPWARNLRFTKALEATKVWFWSCLRYTHSDTSKQMGRWFATQRCSGLRIVPLRTPNELREEGDLMRHCVGDYSDQVAMGACLIYSIRRGNDHIATAEIRPDLRRKGDPFIAQMRGPENIDVDVGVWNTVEKWLSRQRDYPYLGSIGLGPISYDKERWANLWSPFRAANIERKLALDPESIYRALGELSRYT